MDWKRLLIESKSFRDLRNDEKEKIYSEVLNLNPVELDRKYYRKTIEFILLLLQFKGNQVIELKYCEFSYLITFFY